MEEFAVRRRLYTNTYFDICLCNGLDSNNFFGRNYVLWRTIEALDDKLKLGFSLDPDVLDQIAADFEKTSKSQLKGCVSAIDGWAVKTRYPTKKGSRLVN